MGPLSKLSVTFQKMSKKNLEKGPFSVNRKMKFIFKGHPTTNKEECDHETCKSFGGLDVKISSLDGANSGLKKGQNMA